jgi:hypothetical protein
MFAKQIVDILFGDCQLERIDFHRQDKLRAISFVPFSGYEKRQQNGTPLAARRRVR